MKIKLMSQVIAKPLLYGVAALSIPCGAFAATNAELEERIKALEGQLAAKQGSTLKSGLGSDTTVTLGGYIKADTSWSKYSEGELAPGSIGRDFYVPGTIQVTGDSESSDVDYSARESRFFLKTDTDINGSKLTSYIEMDFLVTPNGNERVSNSYSPRMRHAFIKYDNWLFGQTWSTFQDVSALPEHLDFLGPAEGTTFVRQPQIRYSSGNWQVAIENPETTVLVGGVRVVTDDGAVPDVVVRYKHSDSWGYITGAVVGRQLSYEDNGRDVDDSESGFAVSISGKVLFGKDDLRWMISSGSGMGRYIALNTSAGAVLDAEGNIEAIDSTGGFISYRHFWNDQWRSTLSLSALDVDNDTDLTGMNVTSESRSANVNLLYSPNKKLTLGAELLRAKREIESGDDGTMTRLIFSAKYSF